MSTEPDGVEASGGRKDEMRARVYFNEFNILMERGAYLPLVSGLLHSYAETVAGLAERFEFMPYLFHRDHPDRIVAAYDRPAVAAFSVSMWNEQLNLCVARRVKELFPDCLIIFGGAQVPQNPGDYFETHPFIDVAVRGEGEEAFAEILARFLESRDFSGLAGVSFRDPVSGRCHVNAEQRSQSRDLDIYPSPYLTGKFEPLLRDFPNIEFQAIIETNRGCPFPCTFCYWGQGGLSRKYRFASLERVRAMIEWCGEKQIKYVFNADSNFGMHQRDYEIAEMLVATKQRYGFPEKFRTCFGKNSDDKIYAVSRLLHQHDLEKGITLARQSNDETTLENIRRQNIKMSTFRNLQERYNQEDIPVYTEMILGLPGETRASWLAGIEEILQSGLKNQLFVYFCQIYPNTEMDAPIYREKYEIGTVRIPLCEIHGAIRTEGEVPEYEEIIVSTYTMGVADWKEMAIFSWVTQLFHSLKLGFYVLAWLAERHHVRFTDILGHLCHAEGDTLLAGEIRTFHEQLDSFLAGSGRGIVMPEYGNIYFEVEEASYLRLVGHKERLYDELQVLVGAFLAARGIECSPRELEEVVMYQRMRVTSPQGVGELDFAFGYNIPEYFEKIFCAESVPLAQRPQRMQVIDAQDYSGDPRRYMRERLLYARKSNRMLHRVSWKDETLAPVR